MKPIFENNKLHLNDSPFTLTKRADFWRIFLDDGVYREITVHSYKQTPTEVTEVGDRLAISYDRLLAEDGKTYEVDFTVFVDNVDGELRFSFEVEPICDIRVNEVMCPFLDFADCGCPHKDETFYYSNGLGDYKWNPRETLKGVHTEYISSDYNGIQTTKTYPSAWLSMPWYSLSVGKYSLYIGCHDESFNMVGFTSGTNARNADESRLYFAISYYPAANKGEKLTYSGSVLKLFEGDWRLSADYYRKWSESTWYKKQERPEWLRRMTGWQRIIMKHQYGEIFWRYRDLVEVFKNGLKYGINTLLVFGWWKGCFDNHYPEYEIDPELGGEEEFKAAIEEIHRLGGYVHLYTNGNLIDKKTDFYKQNADKCAAIDIDGNPYEEHYRFSNDGSLLRNHGYKSFVTACSGTELWREHLLSIGKFKLSLGADSIFYDQLASNIRICFNDTHLHGKRIDRDPAYKFANMTAIREMLPENKGVGTECVVDRFTNLVDYTHGCCNGFTYSEGQFPDIFRHTFPEHVMSNRNILDERWDYKQHLNYAFVIGLVFDVSVNRGRVCDMSGYPNYAAHVKELIDVKEKYREFFYDGKYESAFDLKLPRGVFAANYVSNGKRITAVCNNSNSAVTLDIYGKEITLEPVAYTVVEF